MNNIKEIKNKKNKNKFKKILPITLLLIPTISVPTAIISSCSSNTLKPEDGTNPNPNPPGPTPTPGPNPPSPTPGPNPPTPPPVVIKYIKLKDNIATNGIGADSSINTLTPNELCKQQQKIKSFIFNNSQSIFDNFPDSLTEQNIAINNTNVIGNSTVRVSITISNATLEDGTTGNFSCSFNITNLRTETAPPPVTIKATKIKQSVVENGINASNELNAFTPSQLVSKNAEVKKWIISNQNSIFENLPIQLSQQNINIITISVSNINSIDVAFKLLNVNLENGKQGEFSGFIDIKGLRQDAQPVSKITELWDGVNENGINATGELATFCDYQVILNRNKYPESLKLLDWIVSNKSNIFKNYNSELSTVDFSIDGIESNGPNSIIVQLNLKKAIVDEQGATSNKLFYLQINNLKKPVKENIYSRADFQTNFIELNDGTLIVNPWTNSEELIVRYGTFPLNLNKNDDELTVDDLVKSIDLMNLYKIPTSYFGCRNVNSTLFAIAFTKWLTSHWKYFPDFSWDNPAGMFYVKGTKDWLYAKNNPIDINEKTWYMKESVNQKWGGDWNYPTDRQYDMFNFISRFLSGLDPKMNDLDKLIYTLLFVCAWMDYTGSNDVDGSVYGPVTYHVGVCLNYAITLSFLLNLAGVPSIPMTVAHAKKGQDYPREVTANVSKHALSWVYLDPYNSGNKKWYSCDPTFFDSAIKGGVVPYFSSFRMDRINFTNALFCNTLVSEFVVANQETLGPGWAGSDRWSQSNYNIYWGMPFGEVYMDKYKDQIGQAQIGLFDLNNGLNGNKIIYSQISDFDEGTKSKPQYYNGKYYFISNRKVYESDLFANISTLQNAKDVTNTFFGNLSPESKNKILDRPMIGKINNYFIFNENDQQIRIHNMLSSDWTNDKILQIPYDIKNGFLMKRINDISFDIDGTVNFTGSYRENYKVIKHKFSNFNIYEYCYQNGLDDSAKQLAKTYYEYLGGFTKIKDNPFDYGINEEAKVNYYKQIDTIMKQNLVTTETIKQLKQNYDGLKSSLNSNLSTIGFTSKNLTTVYTTPDIYNTSKINGVLFPISCWINPYSLISESYVELYKYDIYYSSANTTNLNQFRLLFKGLDSPGFSKTMLGAPQDPNGYYYIKAYLSQSPEVYVNSNIIQVISENNYFEKYPQSLADTKLNVSFQNYSFNSLQTNYFPKIKNWYEQQLRLELNISVSAFDFIHNDIKAKIHRINNQGVNSIVKEIDISFTNSVKENIYIDSKQNGIYYIEFEVRDKNTQSITSRIFSKNTYIFNKSDIDHFNFNTWNNLLNYIK